MPTVLLATRSPWARPISKISLTFVTFLLCRSGPLFLHAARLSPPWRPLQFCPPCFPHTGEKYLSIKERKTIFFLSAKVNIHFARFPRDTALQGCARTRGGIRLRRGEDEAGQAVRGGRQEDRQQVPRGLGQD